MKPDLSLILEHPVTSVLIVVAVFVFWTFPQWFATIWPILVRDKTLPEWLQEKKWPAMTWRAVGRINVIAAVITIIAGIAGIVAFLANWKTASPPKSVQEQSSSPSPSPLTMDEINQRLKEQLGQFEQMNPSATPLQSPVSGTMTPPAIMAEVNSVNPMRREDVAKSFVGAQIDWTLEFFGAETAERFDGKEKYVPCISFALKSEAWGPLVTGELPVERTGELKTVPVGAKIRIKGTIKSVRFHNICRCLRVHDIAMTVV